MVKYFSFLMIFGLIFFSCSENEEPEPLSRIYHPESITSEKAMDIVGNGVVSLDLLDQLRNSSNSGGKNSGTIFLHLYKPEYFNVHFSQVLLKLPHHDVFENRINIEFYQNGRRIDIEDNGVAQISWSTYPSQFEFPEQIHEDIIIESLKTNIGKNRNVELVTSQKLYDHSNSEWIETKVTYIFVKATL